MSRLTLVNIQMMVAILLAAFGMMFIDQLTKVCINGTIWRRRLVQQLCHVGLNRIV